MLCPRMSSVFTPDLNESLFRLLVKTRHSWTTYALRRQIAFIWSFYLDRFYWLGRTHSEMVSLFNTMEPLFQILKEGLFDMKI